MNLLSSFGLLAFATFGIQGVLGALVALCVFVLIAVLFLWLFPLLLNAMGVAIPPNVMLIIKIIIVILFIGYALRVFGIA